MYYKTILDNGLRIITEEIPQFNSVSFGVWINSGGQNEESEVNGISHFIEHLMFKGTKRYTAFQIAEIMDGIGGFINAFTEKEQTCYYTRIMDQHLSLALEILDEILLRSNFNPQEIKKEKCVILEEIKMYEDSPDDLIFDLFNQTIWGDNPLGRSILGEKEIIKRLLRKNILSYLKKHYFSSNIIISAAGHIKHEEVVKKIKKLFQFPVVKDNLENKGNFFTPILQRNIVKYKKSEQVYFCLGGEGVSQKDERKYPLSLLDSILGGSMSSRLFQEIREKRGLVYSISTFQNTYAESGCFGIYANTSLKNLTEVVKTIFSIIKELKENGITLQELKRGKEHLKGAFALALESTTNRMIRLAKSEIYHGRLIPYEEVIEKIDRITLEDVYQIAQKVLDYSKYSSSILGPIKKDFSLLELSK